MIRSRLMNTRIHIHPLLTLFLIISIFTGTFVDLFIMLMIVIWHEIGHCMAAKYFNWQVNTITFSIFGGAMKTDEHCTCPLYEDIIVTLAGPLQHLFIFLLLIFLNEFHFIPVHLMTAAHHYNLLILIFNLLPIYPLDGGKLSFYILSFVFPFKKAYTVILIISIILPLVIFLVQLFFFPFTLSVLLIMSFILYENKIEWKNRLYVFRRFLFSRLQLDKEKRKKAVLLTSDNDELIHVFSKFKRETTYVIYTNSAKIWTEKQCLHAFFNRKKLIKYVKDIPSHS